ncbi:MAG: transketolase [Bacilli bacterium]|nr:transketolase [Bacilli bacterium]
MIGIKKEEPSDIKKIIDNIRALGIDMIDEAKSGHPGIVLGAAPIITTLYANHIKVDINDDKWINRDRFVMSAGHGSALLYSTLFMAGYNIPFEELKNFRQMNSQTPGHPEIGVTKGVDVSTGPLGEGLATSVGIAISECYLRQHFGKDLINYYTYVLCGDGDLMEGISYEACSLAGLLELNKLIVLYDSNDVTLDGALKTSFNENIKNRFEAMNWNYLLVSDGENTESIDEAINKAKSQSNKPTIIEIKTTIGKYSKNEGTSTVHGSPLEKEDITDIKNKLGLRDIPFTISLEVKDSFQEKIVSRNTQVIEQWYSKYNNLNSSELQELEKLVHNRKPIKIKDIYYNSPDDGKDATRNVSGKIINSIATTYPFIIGGSADVSKSTTARINDTLDFSANTPSGRNINFGIRENAMAAIANGMALCNLTPFVSTFFSFSDYLKPGIRMSALMDLPVIYVFTHDSISVGEDGPTHQPVEQLVSLRSIPNFDTYRPADANEVIGSYKAILELRKPAALVLGRNKVKIQESTNSSEVINGAYIVKKENKKLEGIIISTGEELELAMDVYNNLIEKGYGIRLVSMPSMSRFEKQKDEYKEEILPKNVKTFVIEASSSMSWYKYVKDSNYLFTVDDFGASGKRKEVLEKYGLTTENIQPKIEQLLNENKKK